MAVSLTTVGRYLRAWGMTPQKPARRAYERNDSAIKRWLVEEYPALAAYARRERATIDWADEMGLRSDHVTGTSYAPVGQTPCARDRTRFEWNDRYDQWPCVQGVQGKFHNPVFIEFMKRLLRQAKGKLYLIVDGHPVHRSAITRRFVADNPHRLRLIRLPGYCPELNPTSCSIRTSRPTHWARASNTKSR